MQNHEVALAYKRLTEDYDRIIERQPFFINAYRLYDKLLHHILDGKRYKKILDVGCGNAAQTVRLARYGDEVIGVDIAEDLLSVARERCRDFPNVRFMKEDARKLPFPDQTFDCVLSYGDVLSHITDGYERALSEISRVSRTGALISFEVDNKWNAGLLYKPRELRDAIRTRGRGHDTREWEGMRFKTFTHRELADLLNRHGFKMTGFHGHNILASLIPDRYVLEQYRRTFLGSLAVWLGTIDLAVSGMYPFNRFGFNIMVIARKN
ncbi:MAG TPA: class I SAM-dependent methyltransferase [Nitrospiria bacterium]|nr:class I SAM-dependent methyltransferase [Nitrospiria bacterium]